MPLTRSFPIDSGFPNALDVRRLDAGLIAREGVFPDPITAIAAGVAYANGSWNVGARPFVAAVKRGGAPYSLTYGVARLANDAAGTAWTIPAAPVSGSRIDLLWIRATDPTQGEATSGTDGPGGVARAVPIFGQTNGVAAGSPVAPALPAGALLIATVTTPSGAASIAGSTIAQSYGFAFLSGGVAYYRTAAALVADTANQVAGQRGFALDTGIPYIFASGAWVAQRSGFTLIDVVEFTGSGTFTKASYPGLRAVRVRAIGGGGGGGGATATGASQTSGGSGGGAGGYAESLIAESALTASVTVTVGAGGSAASGVAGGNGGASSFGALVVANGGEGGVVRPATASPASAVGGVGGAAGAGDIVTPGRPGGSPLLLLSTSGAATYGSEGGSSQLGAGGLVGAPNANGNPGLGYGAGGGGAAVTQSQVARLGGAGSPGIVIVEVYG